MSHQNSEFVLYSYYRSSASYRVRIALHIKGVDFEYRPVHLLQNGGEQHFKEYQELNPSREVPTLLHRGRPIAQSVAIIDYLDHVLPQNRLFPKDPYVRALVIQSCEIINSGIQPLHNLRVLQELEKRYGCDQEKKTQWSAYWIERGLSALENFLRPNAGKFSFGDTVTAADLFLIPHLKSAERNDVRYDTFENLIRINENCLALKTFQAAAPENQPDTPTTN